MEMNRFFVLALLAASFLSCINKGEKKSSAERGEAEYIASVTPVPGLIFTEGQSVFLSYKLHDEAMTPDSVYYIVDNKKPVVIKPEETYVYPVTKSHRVGKIPFQIEVFKDNASSVAWGEFMVRSTVEPQKYTYVIKNIYPHDSGAYTQGLYWNDGFFYEGTGLNGKSSLRKVDPETGSVLRKVDIADEFFGEGITLLGDNIYQLTWQSGKGFVYDAETFKKKSEFGYPGEGWGLTTDGELLYMSNGSERITIHDPKDFKAVRHIDVYTNKGKVLYLNELEWVFGEIWANVYTEDYVVRIDPKTGIVRGVIDFAGLREHITVTPETDVLNGIAYDKSTGKIFVTGKNWDKLFEVEVVTR